METPDRQTAPVPGAPGVAAPPHPAAAHTMGLLEWSLLITLSVLWGGSFFFGKVALRELPPFTVGLGRVGIAMLLLHGLVLLRGQRMPASRRLWGQFLVMGALNNFIPMSLILWGQTQLDSGLASILNATTPLFTVVLAHAVTADERLTPARLGGVLLGIVGVGVIMGEDALRGLGTHVLAQVAVLGAAASYACAGIYGRRFRGIPPLLTATGQLTGSTLLMLPMAALVDQPWQLPLPGGITWGAVLGLAVPCTVVAYLIYVRLLATAGAVNLLLVTFLIPVSALLLGILILGEALHGADALGMLLIALGLAAIDGRPLRRLRAGLQRER